MPLRLHCGGRGGGACGRREAAGAAEPQNQCRYRPELSARVLQTLKRALRLDKVAESARAATRCRVAN